MASGPKVSETGYTSDTEGPDLDSSSMASGTPPGHESQSDVQYVFDQAQRKATPEGMLSRDVIAQRAHAVEEEHGSASDTKMMVAAAIAFVFVLVLGVIGVGYALSGNDIERIEKQVAAEHGEAPPPPEEVQGVKVRKGIQHEPTAAPKRSDLQPDELPGDGVEELPKNAVPDGERPTDAPPGAPE